jgi:hypothetical protein
VNTLSRFKKNGYGRSMLPILYNSGLSHSMAYSILKKSKIACSPFQYKRRKDAVNTLNKTSKYSQAIDVDKAFSFLDRNYIPGTEDVVTGCQRLFDRYEQDIEAWRGKASVVRLVPTGLIDTRYSTEKLQTYIPFGSVYYSLSEFPELLKFALSVPVLELVAGYLGELPVIANLNPYVSLSDDDEEYAGQKLFHLDGEDAKQVKILIAISDCAEDNGPFTFVSRESSVKVVEKFCADGKPTRYSDEDVLSVVPEETWFKFAGLAGDVLVIDTARCLHFGSRVKRGKRLLLELCYMSYFSPLEPISYYSRLPKECYEFIGDESIVKYALAHLENG